MSIPTLFLSTVSLDYAHKVHPAAEILPTCSDVHGRPKAWARGGAGVLAPWKCFKVLSVLYVVQSLSRRSIYAFVWENVVSFWGLYPRPPPGLCPWTPLADVRPSNPPHCPLPNPGKDPASAHDDVCGIVFRQHATCECITSASLIGVIRNSRRGADIGDW